MDIQARLKRLQKAGLHRGTAHLKPKARGDTSPHSAINLDGEWCSTPIGRSYVLADRHELAEERGEFTYGDCLSISNEAVVACGRDGRLEGFDFRRAAFIDTETSGLAGGTGTFAFLVGIGTFEDESFVVRQYFMHTPEEEKALLYAVGERLDRCDSLVSYNGRVFDLPLLNTRFLLNRDLPRLQTAPHLDLLHPARRLLRARLGSCTLGNVEQQALGLKRADADVPGWLIPSIYRQFLIDGDTQELRGVLYHNLEDILSLVTLATRLCRLFERSTGMASVLDGLHPIDRASLGRALEEWGRVSDGENAYQRALDGPLPTAERDRVLRRLSFLYKRQGRRSEAVPLWDLWSREEIAQTHLVPHVEMAKHFEWHSSNLGAALEWTEDAARIACELSASAHRARLLGELKHRMDRLHRKLSQT